MENSVKYFRNDLDDVLVKEDMDESIPLLGKFKNEDGIFGDEVEIADDSDVSVNTALYGKEITQEEYENA